MLRICIEYISRGLESTLAPLDLTWAAGDKQRTITIGYDASVGASGCRLLPLCHHQAALFRSFAAQHLVDDAESQLSQASDRTIINTSIAINKSESIQHQRPV